MRVSVVGLGPGPLDWITPAARSRLRAPGARVFARTRLFPNLSELLEGVAWESFDALYESAASLDDVHASIVDRLLSAGRRRRAGRAGRRRAGRGHSWLAAFARGASVEVVPGVPLGVGALAAAGLAASDGAQVVEATSLGGSGIELLIELNPRWPAVVTGVYSPRVASDLKLALLRVYPPTTRFGWCITRASTMRAVDALALAELDRAALTFDHLTHVVLPPVVGYAPTGSAHRSCERSWRALRAPEIGCPWDLEQTHRSLIPYVIEEAYEVVDAIESDDVAGLADELGDVLLQVALHAEIADQSDEFEWNDVVRALSEKLVRRHPHVFGDVAGERRRRRSFATGTSSRRPSAAPAAAGFGARRRAAELAAAQAGGRVGAQRANKAGFDWPTREGTLAKVREELAELLAASTVWPKNAKSWATCCTSWPSSPRRTASTPKKRCAPRTASSPRASPRWSRSPASAGWASLADQPLAETGSRLVRSQAPSGSPTGP